MVTMEERLQAELKAQEEQDDTVLDISIKIPDVITEFDIKAMCTATNQQRGIASIFLGELGASNLREDLKR